MHSLFIATPQAQGHSCKDDRCGGEVKEPPGESRLRSSQHTCLLNTYYVLGHVPGPGERMLSEAATDALHELSGVPRRAACSGGGWDCRVLSDGVRD